MKIFILRLNLFLDISHKKRNEKEKKWLDENNYLLNNFFYSSTIPDYMPNKDIYIAFVWIILSSTNQSMKRNHTFNGVYNSLIKWITLFIKQSTHILDLSYL